VDILGSFALLLAFLAAVYAVLAGIAGIITRRTLLTKSARNAGMAVFVLVTVAVGCLEYFFFTNDFSIVYVVEHSNRALPAFYKFAALWAGQEGSLLPRFVPESQASSRTDALRRGGSRRRADFFPHAE
jgi:cytochrome c-type biogenesis protein CcmF